MFITWHGNNCFRIQSKETTILIDPFSADTGLSAPRMTGDAIIFSSLQDPLIAQAEKGSSFVVSHAGEYEVQGILINGVSVEQSVAGKKDATELITLTTVTAEDVIVGHLGSLHGELKNGQLEILKNVDVLLVPVGGGTVMNAAKAVEMISQIEPRVVIPYAYHVKGLKEKMDDVGAFLKEIGKPGIAAIDKARIQKKDLPESDMEVIVLSVA